MKFILSIALIVAIAGFINAQSPPVINACVAYVNTTGTEFCSGSVSYPVLNTTNFVPLNTQARTNFDATLAALTNPSAACRTALTTYYCHNSISRCARSTIFNRVVQATCDAVVSACNITAFPGNFTGSACVPSTVASVEGSNLVCIPTNTVALGASCSNLLDPLTPTPATVAYSACPAVGSCNNTATNPTCVAPNNVGDVCTSNAGCISNAFSGNAVGSVGTPLTCISGRCSYGGKRFQQTCFSNGECASGNCTSGACYESGFGGACTTSFGCRNNLYCDTKNSTCYNAALGGEACGFLQANWDLVPCVAGFTCVRGVNGTASVCRPNANIGEACTVSTTSVVQDAPICSPSTLPTTGIAECINNVCRVQTLGAEGSACNVTTKCNPTLTCSYASSTATEGTCAQPNTVACSNVVASNCNELQRCNCGADATQTGTCAVDTTNFRVACASQILALTQCSNSKCNSAPFVAYEASACPTTQCLQQLNAFYCCAKSTVGANFVAPANMPTDPCVTPSPTPGPTSPTGTGTPVPIQSSKRSSATTVAISFIALIIAVVAFL
jgi:hypothetical protein